MIPKIIHYCWFGSKPLPEHNRKCVQSWRKWCPDFKIVRWSEKNFPYQKYRFTKRAHQLHNWAAISDYVRLYALEKMGGIYLDTDVMMIRSITPFLHYQAFIGMENPRAVASGLIFGATRANPNVLALLQLYNQIAYQKDLPLRLNDQVYITTAYFYQRGFRFVNRKQFINGCHIYPTEYFCPNRLDDQKGLRLTKHTYSIHEYDGNWSKTSQDQRQSIFNHEFHRKFEYYLTEFKSLDNKGC